MTSKTAITLLCYRCGVMFDRASGTAAEARRKASALGWKHQVHAGRGKRQYDACPDCPLPGK